ncbi:sulfite exporter TauE/SafE family protein [Paracoccus sediminicola]|uniref:sulfite exporter TauE/SafE family protein n=1 Tax=Paracoccus sediminicola TaxID=3017783 RepID=UPI0022F12C2C|nr:sulfite exporter TauE/SafE family protein [Paracoccus sediminicola]WBU56665.1 sulfite exporter TauE/SafE family protein [Paracoccus sediminicola]
MIESLAVAMIAFLMGGILKGAIGAGTPVIVVPITSIYFGVHHAVALFVLPALASNIWQAWQYRQNIEDRGFVWRLVISGAVGAFFGTLLLAALPADLLSIVVGSLALFYVGFRLLKPDWSLRYGLARMLAAPAGLAAGLLQGAAGISAPISVTFLHAVRLPRERFIPTISAMFTAMTAVQFPSLIGVGLMSWQILAISVIACIPLFAGMPLGAVLVRRVGVRLFDRLIMALLFVIALRLILGAT